MTKENEKHNTKQSREIFIQSIIDYFKRGEKSPCNLTTGIELEFFVVKKDKDGNFKRIHYKGESGVEEILKELFEKVSDEAKQVAEIFSDGHLIGFQAPDYSVTLEPGAQLELSIKPVRETKEAREIYDSFTVLIESIIKPRNIELLSCSYNPDVSEKFPPLIPKKRYKYMDEWFLKTGTMGREMMRNTCSTQVAFDYCDEADFVKKYRTAVRLKDEIIKEYDNPPMIPRLNEVEYKHIRSKIWENVDPKRCDTPPGVFDDDFGYLSYAKYIMDVSPIVIERKINKEIHCVYVGTKTVGELWEEGVLTCEDIPHILSMVFPEVRLRDYIEIRYADSLPASKAFEYMEKMKSLIYDDELIEKNGGFLC